MSNSNDNRPPYDTQEYNANPGADKPASPESEHHRISDSDTYSSPEQTAAYLADMLQEMQTMAEKSGHSSLSELLEFAHREALWRSRPVEESRELDELR